MNRKKQINERRDEIMETIQEWDGEYHDEYDELMNELYALTMEYHQDDENLITEDYFDENFTQIKNPFEDNASFSGCMFETYGQELEYIRHLAKQTKRVWTIVEGDYDSTLLVAGCHLVNRIGYIVTEEEWPSEESYVLLD